MVLLRVIIYGQTTTKGSICKMASVLLTKSVETHYSGTGKIIKGTGKLNFSSTESFKCMRDVVTKKFGDSEECKNFVEKVGKWLSGCNDREHGRKERSLST
ncbi:uncharacterized protein LOC123267538 [Cotesia glomerata]|uniref:uncharacterized protein LOC123267538 n=1 Tax=Cotesia glomerata TaxID=32391 RepID=UPI001D01D17A|nr:uncharacterized protein LOC123267538 [Cotesia glomerata]